MDSQKLIKQEIVDHNLQVKAIIQVSKNRFLREHFREIKFLQITNK